MNIGDKLENMSFEIFQNEEIKKVSFDDYKGKWVVLLFYPADFTFVCPTELGEAADFYDKFKEEGAEIISVSTDTVFTHKAWHDESPTIKKINYPMAADPTGKLCKYFGTYIEDEGMSLRGTFIINPEGNVISMDIHSNDIGRSTSEILRKLQAAIFTAKNGVVCPASWKPGDKTLSPGLDLVGKI